MLVRLYSCSTVNSMERQDIRLFVTAVTSLVTDAVSTQKAVRPQNPPA